jgi:hypothetical protein
MTIYTSHIKPQDSKQKENYLSTFRVTIRLLSRSITRNAHAHSAHLNLRIILFSYVVLIRGFSAFIHATALVVHPEHFNLVNLIPV